MTESTILHNSTPEQLVNLIDQRTRKSLDKFKKELLSQNANDDLLTRDQACAFLQITSTTLWDWTNKGKIKAYGISGARRYYKRSELIAALKPVNK